LTRTETRSGTLGTLTTSHTYDSFGRRTKTISPGLPPQLVQYDTQGRPYRSGYDVDSNNALDLGGLDPITENTETHVKEGGRWFRRSTRKVWNTDNQDTAETSFSSIRTG